MTKRIGFVGLLAVALLGAACSGSAEAPELTPAQQLEAKAAEAAKLKRDQKIAEIKAAFAPRTSSWRAAIGSMSICDQRQRVKTIGLAIEAEERQLPDRIPREALGFESVEQMRQVYREEAKTYLKDITALLQVKPHNRIAMGRCPNPDTEPGPDLYDTKSVTDELVLLLDHAQVPLEGEINSSRLKDLILKDYQQRIDWLAGQIADLDLETPSNRRKPEVQEFVRTIEEALKRFSLDELELDDVQLEMYADTKK